MAIIIFIAVSAIGFSLSWPSLADVIRTQSKGVAIGNMGVVLSDGENLIWGEVNNAAAGAANFFKLQKGGADKYKIDSSGNVVGNAFVVNGAIRAAGALSSQGQLVCLKDGTNCPPLTSNQILGVSGNSITLSDDGTVIAPYAVKANSINNGANCPSGQYPRGFDKQGNALNCAAVAGTVTAVTAGPGLTGGVITGQGTIALDSASISGCTGANKKIIWGSSNLTCADDNITSAATLQNVTDVGATTDKTITAAGFTTSGGAINLNLANNIINAAPAAGSGEVAVNKGSLANKGFTIYDGGTANSPFRVDSAGDVFLGNTAFNQKLNLAGSELNFNQTTWPLFYIDANRGVQLKVDADNNDASTFTINDGGNNKRWEIDESGAITTGSIPWTRLNSFPSVCPAGQLVVGMGAALTCASPVGAPQNLWNYHVPQNNSAINNIAAGDFSGTPGRFISRKTILISGDGLPIIFYYNVAGNSLRAAKCLNPDCSQKSDSLIDSAFTGVTWHPYSAVIGPDGMPIIVYYIYKSSFYQIYVYKCSDYACSAGSVLNYFNPGSVNTVEEISAAIGFDGLVAFVYHTTNNGALMFRKCLNSTCSSFSSEITLDSDSGQAGYNPALIMASDGLPMAVYVVRSSFTQNKLKAAKCADINCSSRSVYTLINTASNVKILYPSIAITWDGIPLITYSDQTNSNTRVIKCANASCSSAGTPVTINTASICGNYSTNMVIGYDGLPLVSYCSGANNATITKCGYNNCSASGGNATTVLGTGADMLSAALGLDGLPIVTYYTASDSSIKTVRCGSDSCMRYWYRR